MPLLLNRSLQELLLASILQTRLTESMCKELYEKVKARVELESGFMLTFSSDLRARKVYKSIYIYGACIKGLNELKQTLSFPNNCLFLVD
jgi:hypothetical protein